jgi:nitrite reductase (NADH) large subunit
MTPAVTVESSATGADASRRAPRRRGAGETVVVIGNGMAGWKLCERATALAGPGRLRLVVFGEEPSAAYDRVHLTRLLERTSPDDLLLAPREWYAERGIELHTGDPVVTVDCAAKFVRAASGREVRYDRLVFATGSRAHLPEIPGNDLPGVFVYRTTADLLRIRSAAASAKRAVVLGGGLLGLEAAGAVRALGPATWIVERGTGLLARHLDPQSSALLQSLVSRTGVQICTSREAERIERIGDDLLVQFNTGECLRAQLVIFATGIRPRDELARAAGLRVAPRGGIEVDDALRTSGPDVFAIGECASHRGEVYGLAAPAYRMAEVLAEGLAGRRAAFTGWEFSTTLKLPGIAVATFGEFQAEGDTVEFLTKECSRRLVLAGNRLIGAVGVGDWPEQARVCDLVERRAFVWRWQRDRFAKTGSLWRAGASLSVAQWPAEAIVCNCVGVRRGTLSAACAGGCSTLEKLSQCTGAGTVCGSCRPLLAELAGAPVPALTQPAWRLLLGASLVALLAAVLFALLPPVPFADSVQVRFRPEVLWTDDLAKQVTGWGLVALAAASLLLSARKRVKRFQAGEVGHWRAVHGALGVLSLLLLVTHTGLRLGHNLNLILMLNFLALAFAGGLAGAVTALERRMDGLWARRLRAAWTGCHLALTWPLPALVLFHVVAAYYF